MADETATPIQRKAIERYIRATQPQGRCESCGSSSFGIINEEDQNAMGTLPMLRFPNISLGDSGRFDVIVLVCEQCATLRFLSRRYVHEWIAKNPA